MECKYDCTSWIKDWYVATTNAYCKSMFLGRDEDEGRAAVESLSIDREKLFQHIGE